MRIKRFVQTNIILSILLIVILYGLSWIYVNYVNDRTVKFMEYNKLPDNSVDLVVLGSSHGKYGIKVWDKNQMNLALESQGMYYNSKLLEKYEKKIKQGAKVIIPLSVFSFYEPDYSKNIKNENYKNYINILNKKEIESNLSWSEYILTHNFSVLYPPVRIMETFNFLINSLKKNKLEKNRMYYIDNLRGKEFKENAKGHAESHISKTTSKMGLKYAISLLELCRKNNWETIFIVVPCHEYYIDELNNIEKDIINKRIYTNLNKLENLLNKKYKLLDYSRDNRFYNNEEYFLNADHLNEKGAEYFTKILLKDIDERIKRNE